MLKHSAWLCKIKLSYLEIKYSKTKNKTKINSIVKQPKSFVHLTLLLLIPVTFLSNPKILTKVLPNLNVNLSEFLAIISIKIS